MFPTSNLLSAFNGVIVAWINVATTLFTTGKSSTAPTPLTPTPDAQSPSPISQMESNKVELNYRQIVAFVSAFATPLAASAAAWGQPTHLWLAATFAAIAGACSTLTGFWNKVQ